MEDNREHIDESPEEPQEIGTEKSMGSTSGSEIEEEEQQRDQPQPVGQTEDTARLNLMEISKAVPPADEAADLNEGGHSHHQSPERASSSPSARPDTEEEIRRKLMSISYSFDQPGQPVAG